MIVKLNTYKDCVANTPEDTEERAAEDDEMTVRYAKCGTGVDTIFSV